MTGNAVLAAGISAKKSRNNTVEANTLTCGPLLLKNGSNFNTALGNTVAGAETGFRLVESHRNVFENNTAAGNEIGFRIARAHDNIFTSNEVTGAGEPLRITGKDTKTYSNIFSATSAGRPPAIGLL